MENPVGVVLQNSSSALRDVGPDDLGV